MELFEQNVTINSAKSVSEIVAVLKSVTRKISIQPFTGELFIGTVEESTFEISPVYTVLRVRPKTYLTGQIYEKDSETQVQVSAKTGRTNVVLAISVMALLLVLKVFAECLLQMIKEGITGDDMRQVICSLVVAIAISLGIYFVFVFLPRRALKQLQELIE